MSTRNTKQKEEIEQLILKMSPLAKRYATKVHFMDYEDTLQEFYIALVIAGTHLKETFTEAQCVKYLEKAVDNHYKYLCRKHLPIEPPLNLDDHQHLESSDHIDHTALDISRYIQSVTQQDQTKGEILTKSFLQDKSDAEIAFELGISKQYVNRIKRQLFKPFLDQYK